MKSEHWFSRMHLRLSSRAVLPCIDWQRATRSHYCLYHHHPLNVPMSLRNNDAQRNQDAVCYVGNLDERADDGLLWELMLQAGPVVRVHIPRDRVTGQHNAFGFAEFQTPADADYAVSIMNGVKLFGRALRVNKASADKKDVDIGANLFVRNLDPDADERDLLDAFAAFGNIVNLQVCLQRGVTGSFWVVG